MGQNGAGKSTLLTMVAGALTPDAGTVRLGPSVKLGYFAQQSLDVLDPELTVWEQLDRKYPLSPTGTKRNLLGGFQFSGDEIDKRIEVLSGGEKARLVLARMLFDPPNFLVLDEPTNHLDLETKEMLVDSLKDFEGTMMFVSHDRTFLRGLSNRVSTSAPARRAPAGGVSGQLRQWVERFGMEARGARSGAVPATDRCAPPRAGVRRAERIARIA
jgi:ATPase subunit of ABC transporter with duplicated ATPase domains